MSTTARKPRGIRMTETENGDYGITWMSDPINHGDWPFRYQIRLEYADQHDEEWARTSGNYIVEILVTSPVASEAKLGDVASSMGIDVEEFQAAPDVAQHEMLREYGLAPQLFSSQGHNKTKLLRAAREELRSLDFLFGFAMDRPQNMMGTSGWDWIRGEL